MELLNRFTDCVSTSVLGFNSAAQLDTPGKASNSVTNVALAVLAAVVAVSLVSFAIKFTIDILFIPAVILALVAIGLGVQGGSDFMVSSQAK